MEPGTEPSTDDEIEVPEGIDESFDQYAGSGAPNFPMAVEKAVELYNALGDEAAEELVCVTVTRLGAVQPFGKGEQFPTNEEQPTEMGFIVTREDILENGLDEDGEGEEEPEAEASPIGDDAAAEVQP